MLTVLKKIFTWWNQDTFGTRLKTIFFGKLIGTDEKNLISLELEDFGHGLPKDSIIKYHQNWIKKYFTE